MITHDGLMSLVKWWEEDPDTRQFIIKYDYTRNFEAYVFESNSPCGQFVSHADQIDLDAVRKEKLKRHIAEINEKWPGTLEEE